MNELAAAFLQAAITLGLAALFGLLYRRYRKPYFRWWAVAWLLYAVRIGAIIGFLATNNSLWLYWHQVVTGWTALALLWAALVFSQQLRFRRRYLWLTLFPPVWSYVAIYRLQDFLLAAGPAVIFLSLATFWSGAVFLRHRRQTGSTAAAILAGTLILWGLHHLDYPFLRARGAWSPWGYYLDIIFLLALGGGILLLVVEDLHRGLNALSSLSGDLQIGGPTDDRFASLLRRPLGLPGVRGSALCLTEPGGERIVGGAGICQSWTGWKPSGTAAAAITEAISSHRLRITRDLHDPADPEGARYAYAAVLPVFRGSIATGALMIVGDARDPFTALDERFLLALGQQVGAALENAELYQRLEERTADLEHLATRMVRQHEEQRRRISLELHDETAQVFSALKLELGVLREGAAPESVESLEHLITLVDAGMKSIREVTQALRPSLLDDLGLLPALRALAAGFGERSGIAIRFESDDSLPQLSDEAELGLFRALQEGLANVARHAGASSVAVAVTVIDRQVVLGISDDGRGILPGTDRPMDTGERLGLVGMRERITALGGTVQVGSAAPAGARLDIRVPVPEATP